MSKSRVSEKLGEILNSKSTSISEIARIIEKGSSDLLKKICKLDRERIEKIFSGSSPSFIETMIIMQALGESVSSLGYLKIY